MGYKSLLDKLIEHFNQNELSRLCFDLNIRYDSLEGNSSAKKAQELIEYCDRHNRIGELVQELSHKRPQIPWEEFAENAQVKTIVSKQDDTTGQSIAESSKDLPLENQTIDNIIFLGELLKAVIADELRPKKDKIVDVTTIREALDMAFNKQFKEELEMPIAMAGQILKDVFIKWQPKTPVATLPYKRILRGIAPHLVNKLKELGYWENYRVRTSGIRWLSYRSQPNIYSADVIWLPTLQQLWTKYKKVSKLYGIAEIKWKNENSYVGISESLFLVKEETSGYITETYHKTSIEEEDVRFDFYSMGNSDFRLFVTGLVLDIVNLADTSWDDLKLWRFLDDVLPDKEIS